MGDASEPRGWELAHRYGAHVHVLDNPFLTALLARLGGCEVRHPEMTELLRDVYRFLIQVAAGRELPRVEAAVPTRMVRSQPSAGIWSGVIVDPGASAVVVDVIRAGILPAQVAFEMLARVLPDERVRLDHLHMARICDGDGRVTGTDLSGSKIGGSVDGATLFLPDPMGATGSTTIRAWRHYREFHGTPRRVVAIPMIATPEYLRAVTDEVEDLVVYTARVDRGLSAPDVLAARPGARWDEERGLDEHGYIVPGAGGLGEVLNNSWC